MSDYDFHLKRGDTSPALRAQLLDEDDEPIDLSSATVRFRMMRYDSDTVAVDSGAVVEDATSGEVSYQWKGGETDATGTYQGEFAVDKNGGTGDGFDADETVPNHEWITIKIEDSLA